MNYIFLVELEFKFLGLGLLDTGDEGKEGGRTRGGCAGYRLQKIEYLANVVSSRRLSKIRSSEAGKGKMNIYFRSGSLLSEGT